MAEHGTILVVDDEPDIVETLQFALRRRGFQVRTARDGAEGMAMAREQRPDLMLLDVMLPGMNGYEISRQLKESMSEDDEFPIVLLTARRVDTPERHEFVSTWSKADAVLYKPFALDRLVGEIEEQLAAATAEG